MRQLTRILNLTLFNQPDFWTWSDKISTVVHSGERESISNDFAGYVNQAYKANGALFACMLVRQLVFSEARFQYRRLIDGRPSELFGTEDLALLERPWPNGTTGELLSKMEQHGSLAGNFYGTTVGRAGDRRNPRRVRVLRPDWVTIVTGSPTDDPFDIEARPIAYLYAPRGPKSSREPVMLTVNQVVHWSPIPDPLAQWRGMSWLTPVIEEITADKATTRHKTKFFENGAVGGLTVTYDANLPQEDFDFFVEKFNEQHTGVGNAYKTIHLGGGADAKVVGANPQQLDFKSTQGVGETRIAAASGVGAVIAQLSEGMQGSSLNAGNYAAARRRVADGTFRPLWRSAAAALEKFAAPVPEGAHLWYDARDVPFLRDDAKEEADTRLKDATTLEALIRAGYTPESATRAVTTGNFSLLEHTGKTSVQLHPDEGDTT